MKFLRHSNQENILLHYEISITQQQRGRQEPMYVN